MDLALHRVDGRCRVNLEGIVDKGVEFYTAARGTDADGTETGEIILTPVKVVTTAVKRTNADPLEQDQLPGVTVTGR